MAGLLMRRLARSSFGLGSVLTFVVLFAALVGAADRGVEGGFGGGSRKLAGADRYETAVLLAANALDSREASSDEVVVVSGESLVDALSAASLAAAKSSVVLLTRTATLPAAVKNFIHQRGFAAVTIVGGPAAVSPEVEAQLGRLASVEAVNRVQGPDRYATSAQVASVSTPGGWCGAGEPTVVVVSGVSLIDGVLAAPVAYAMGLPVLYTRPDVLPAEVAGYLDNAGVGRAVVIGSETEVGSTVASQLEEKLAAVTRVGGDDAPRRSVALADALHDCGDAFDVADDGYALVDSEVPVDGVAAAAALANGLGMAERKGELVPVLAVSETLPSSVRSHLRAVEPDNEDEVTVWALGGVERITPELMSSAIEAVEYEPPARSTGGSSARSTGSGRSTGGGRSSGGASSTSSGIVRGSGGASSRPPSFVTPTAAPASASIVAQVTARANTDYFTVLFDKPVNPVQAQNTANYRINGQSLFTTATATYDSTARWVIVDLDGMRLRDGDRIEVLGNRISSAAGHARSSVSRARGVAESHYAPSYVVAEAGRGYAAVVRQNYAVWPEGGLSADDVSLVLGNKQVTTGNGNRYQVAVFPNRRNNPSHYWIGWGCGAYPYSVHDCDGNTVGLPTTLAPGDSVTVAADMISGEANIRRTVSLQAPQQLRSARFTRSPATSRLTVSSFLNGERCADEFAVVYSAYHAPEVYGRALLFERLPGDGNRHSNVEIVLRDSSKTVLGPLVVVQYDDDATIADLFYAFERYQSTTDGSWYGLYAEGLDHDGCYGWYERLPDDLTFAVISGTHGSTRLSATWEYGLALEFANPVTEFDLAAFVGAQPIASPFAASNPTLCRVGVCYVDPRVEHSRRSRTVHINGTALHAQQMPSLNALRVELPAGVAADASGTLSPAVAVTNPNSAWLNDVVVASSGASHVHFGAYGSWSLLSSALRRGALTLQLGGRTVTALDGNPYQLEIIDEYQGVSLGWGCDGAARVEECDGGRVGLPRALQPGDKVVIGPRALHGTQHFPIEVPVRAVRQTVTLKEPPLLSVRQSADFGVGVFARAANSGSHRIFGSGLIPPSQGWKVCDDVHQRPVGLFEIRFPSDSAFADAKVSLVRLANDDDSDSQVDVVASTSSIVIRYDDDVSQDDLITAIERHTLLAIDGVSVRSTRRTDYGCQLRSFDGVALVTDTARPSRDGWVELDLSFSEPLSLLDVGALLKAQQQDSWLNSWVSGTIELGNDYMTWNEEVDELIIGRRSPQNWYGDEELGDTFRLNYMIADVGRIGVEQPTITLPANAFATYGGLSNQRMTNVPVRWPNGGGGTGSSDRRVGAVPTMVRPELSGAPTVTPITVWRRGSPAVAAITVGLASAQHQGQFRMVAVPDGSASGAKGNRWNLDLRRVPDPAASDDTSSAVGVSVDHRRRLVSVTYDDDTSVDDLVAAMRSDPALSTVFTVSGLSAGSAASAPIPSGTYFAVPTSGFSGGLSGVRLTLTFGSPIQTFNRATFIGGQNLSGPFHTTAAQSITLEPVGSAALDRSATLTYIYDDPSRVPTSTATVNLPAGTVADSGGTTNLAFSNVRTAAFGADEPPAINLDAAPCSTIECVFERAALRRARVVHELTSKINSGQYGVGADNVLRGPAGFAINLNQCPRRWNNTQGITSSEVRIGHTTARSGSQAHYGNITVGWENYLDWVNEHDPLMVNGSARDISLVVYDDHSYAPYTSAYVNYLVHYDRVFAVNTYGTPNSLASYDAINAECVPSPYVMSAHPAWGDPRNHPWTTGMQMSHRTEAILWLKWIKDNLASQLPVKVTGLVIDNDFGRAYEETFRAWASANPDIVSEFVVVWHYPGARTVTNEMRFVQSTAPDVLIAMTEGNSCLLTVYAADAVGVTDTLDAAFMPSVCRDVGAYMRPAGDAGDDWWIVGGGTKDTSDPRFANDPFVSWLNSNLEAAGLATSNSSLGAGYWYGYPYVESLRVAAELPGGLTRANFLLAARAVDIDHPLLLDGINFAMRGDGDAYPIEGSEFLQYDAATHSWIQVGDAVDLDGHTRNCYWSPSRKTCYEHPTTSAGWRAHIADRAPDGPRSPPAVRPPSSGGTGVRLPSGGGTTRPPISSGGGVASRSLESRPSVFQLEATGAADLDDNITQALACADVECVFELAAARRQRVVADIARMIDAGVWGVGDDDVLRGPGGFEIDLSACPADWDNSIGITDTEVRIGHTTAQSGNLAAYGNIAVGWENYLDWVNENDPLTLQDGTTRDMVLIVYDDAYVAAQTIEFVDELIESENVFSILTLGSPNTLATYDTINDECIPHPYVMTGHPAWGDPVNHPWTTGLQLSYSTEALLWGRWIEENLADQLPVVVAGLVMDNDFGLAYESGFDNWAASNPDVVSRFEAVRHDPAAGTLTNEMSTIKAADPDVFISMTAGNPCLLAVQEAGASGLNDIVEASFAPSVCKGIEAYMKPAGEAGHDWWIFGGGAKDTSDPNYIDEPFISWLNDNLDAAGLDSSISLYGTGYWYGYPYVESLRIAAALPGGLTRTNFILAVRATDIYHPMLLGGIKFALDGFADSFAIEGSDVSQYDATMHTWNQLGNAIDINGHTPNCVWTEGGCMDTPGDPPWIPAQEGLKVGLVTDTGRIDDRSFNQAAWEGVLLASGRWNLEAEYIETESASDYESNINQLIDDGYDVIVTVGFGLAEATLAAADANPGVLFIGVDQFQGEVRPNVAGLIFPEDQSGFLAGALAGLLTETNIVGAVLGTDLVPPVVAFKEGWENGARYTNPEVETISTYHPGGLDTAFGDPEWGATTARQALDQGADIIFGAGGSTGNGALTEIASEPGALCVGVDTDQWYTVPEAQPCLVTSAMKLITPGVISLVRKAIDDNFPPGNFVGLVGLAPLHDFEHLVTDQTRATIVEIAHGQRAGTLSTGYTPGG